MLEIFAVMWLCNKNKQNAQMRGHKGGAYVAITLLLWIGFEVLGFVIGAVLELGYGAYLLALVLAVVGGFISYGIAKAGEPNPALAAMIPGMAPLPNAGWMEQPVPLTIVRDKAFVASMATSELVLNGQPIGNLSNGSQMTVYTQYIHNVIIVRNAMGVPPFYFSVVPGGSAEIHLSGVQFQPQLCIGCAPIAQAAVAAALTQQPVQPPVQQQWPQQQQPPMQQPPQQPPQPSVPPQPPEQQ